MPGEETRERQPSLARIFISSGGMFFVALVCAAAGLLFGLGRRPNLSEASYVVAYAFLIYPYFYGRYASVEGPSPTPQELSDRGRFVPAILFALFFAPFILIGWFSVPREALLNWVGLMVLGISPFVYLGVRTQWQLTKSAEAARRERLFKNKVLLPAFATCLVSFSFGWATSQPSSAFVSLLFPIVLIVVGRELITDRGWVRVVYFMLATIVGSFIFSQVAQSQIGKLIITGIILTFAMGVAEVCKRVVLMRQGSIPVEVDGTSSEGLGYYLAGSNWASVVFPLLVCFLPLLISELPVVPIFLVLSIQYLHWHFFFPQKSSKWLTGLNVFLGFSLPAVLCVQFYSQIFQPTLFNKDLIGDLYGFLALAVAVAFFALQAIFGGRKLQQLFAGIRHRDTYLDYDNCYLFFLMVSVAVVAIILALVLFVGIGFPYEIRPKATETILCILLLWAIASFFYTTRRPVMLEHRPIANGGDSRKVDDQFQIVRDISGQTIFLLVIYVGRLLVGIIGALSVILILILNTSIPWYLLLLHGVPICATTMAGFVLNDIYDLEKDQGAGIRKPLAIGLVPVSVASGFGFLLVILALLSAAFISQHYSYYVICAAVLGIAAYSALARHFPLLKGFLTAILCCAPFAYGSEVAGIDFPIRYYLFLGAFIVGRELLLDVRDFDNDQSANIRTLVAYLGMPMSRIVGWALMVGSIALVLFGTHGFGLLMFVAALISLAICFALYFRNESLGLAWSRVTLLMGVVAVVFSL